MQRSFSCDSKLTWWQKSEWASLHSIVEKIGKEGFFFWLFVFNEWKQRMLLFLDLWNEMLTFGFEFFFHEK